MDFHFCHDDDRFRPANWPYALDFDFARWVSKNKIVEVRRRGDFICFMTRRDEQNWQGDAYWYQGFDADQHRDILDLTWDLGDAAGLKFNLSYDLGVTLTAAALATLKVLEEDYDFRDHIP